MANPEHLKILEQGLDVWNKWRRENPKIQPDFSSEDFTSANFSYANFANANLSYVDLNRTNLNNVDLTGATLAYASLTYTKLSGTKFNDAIIGYTVLANTDLSEAVGLETVMHIARSEVGINTIYRSQGQIPEVFLRGCGVPDTLIEYLPSLLIDPLQFYSCFISYSSKNQLFSDRLYADLQNKGVRCWLASEDLKIGDKIRFGIDESIRFHDKLLLILSKHSVASDWVEQEVETALARERREKRTVLFPIRLDDTVMKVDTGWPALIKNTRNIGDFRKWRNPEAYQKAFDKLLRDLKAGD